MKKTESEAPVPRPFGKKSKHHGPLAQADVSDFVAAPGPKHALPLRVAQAPIEIPKGPWSVFCNSCDKVMSDYHYHCSVCDGGDFDLCESCVSNGKACPGENHWLIKRSIEDGKVVSSTTERLAPKIKQTPTPKSESEKDVPGAFTEDVKSMAEAIRTCNACVASKSCFFLSLYALPSTYAQAALPDHEFITCLQCEDYDLCLACHKSNKHGHHPGHHFKPAIDGTELSLAEEALLPAGRNVRHNALCDGCDKAIHGVRHKCFECPDFDYCSECYKNARHSHPRHRFAAVYDELKGRLASSVSHHGIYCDGPLCKDKPHQSYIQGVRYKCVVCHDTDFCQSCEALPTSFHNKTHPLVKFKTPINHLTITTENETKNGVRKLGDRDLACNVNPRSTCKQSENATVPAKTVANIQPSSQAEEKEVGEKLAEKEAESPALVSATRGLETFSEKSVNSLQGHFVADRIPDGTVVCPNQTFVQAWTISNPGPHAWPAGCSVRFVGGDNMLNVDNSHAAAVSDIADATESNVIGREVLAGEKVDFELTMKAPPREGKFISYWRIKSADGTPFGHRLWCDIDVKRNSLEGPQASPANESNNKSTSSLAADRLSTARAQIARCSERMNAEKKLATSSAAERSAAIRAQLREQMELMMAKKDLMSQTATADQSCLNGVETSSTPVTHTMSVSPLAAGSSAQTQSYYALYKERINTLKNHLDQTGTGSTMPESLKDANKPTDAVGTRAETSEPKQDDAELNGSQMVFPTLERESPASSTYQSFTGSGISKKSEETEQASQTSEGHADVGNIGDDGFEDISEDLEVLSANDEGESVDDGFLTDDDYDILDASDQETVASMK